MSPAPREEPRPDAAAAAREQNELGLEHLSGGRLAEAAQAFARAIELQHDFAAAHLNLGTAYERQQQAEDAADSYRLAAHFNPELAPARFNLGRMLSVLGRDDEARAEFNAALALDPDMADAHMKLARLAQKSGDHEAALHNYNSATRLRPDWAEAHCNAALALYDLGRYEESRSRSEAALRLQPGMPEACHNLGLALLALGEPEAALGSLGPALDARPRLPECLAAAGHALRDLGRIDDAIAHYDAALTLDPDLGDAYINRCYARLLAGDFERGWVEYERRFQAANMAGRGFPYPVWKGDGLAGRTLLVYAEQGLGDEIMFASCLPDVLAAASGCVIECHTRLERLYRRSFPRALVHGSEKTQDKGWLDSAPRVDIQVAVGSLPLHLRRTRASFPRHSGYLRADPDRVAHWSRHLADANGTLRLGLSWRGGTPKTRSHLRSVPLELLRPLLRPEFTLVSLQHGATPFELQAAAPIRSFAGVTEDLDDLAALICALDLVVSVDNTNVHLAGALGRPVWALLPASTEWRYGSSGETMPWYPSARLFRQQPGESWSAVVERVARALSCFSSS